MSGSALVAEWISAISTSVLGLLGLGFGAWQWTMSRFRPKIRARIDIGRDAIEVFIVNKGRASGIICQVDIQKPDSDDLVDKIRFEGLPKQRFVPMTLPAISSTRLILTRPDKLFPPDCKLFPPDCKLVVDIGKTRLIKRKVEKVKKRMGFVGLQSVLPPARGPA